MLAQFFPLQLRRRISNSNAWLHLHMLVGHVRRLGRYVRRVWPGSDPCSDSSSQAVYAHYDPEGIIHDYVVEQMRQLAVARFRVTFVSNARKLTEESAAAVKPFCRQVIWRRNLGYDFGAYKDGIAHLGDLDGCDRLLLMNDSVYGPFRPLDAILDAVSPSQLDFWGITDSWDRHYHLQSYFILFFPTAITSRAFRKFWRRLPYVNNKLWVIRNGEIMLTQRLTQHKIGRAHV